MRIKQLIRLLAENLDATIRVQRGEGFEHNNLGNIFLWSDLSSLLIRSEKFKRDKSRIPGYQYFQKGSLNLGFRSA